MFYQNRRYSFVLCYLKLIFKRSQVFHKKGVLRNFAKFTRKHLCQSLFFNKVAGLRRLIKKGVFS